MVAPPWSAVQVLYGTNTYSATAAPYNPLGLNVSLLSHGYGTGFAAYMGPRASYAGGAGDISDPATLFGDRGGQKHIGVWYDAGGNENTSGYSNPVHVTYDMGTDVRISALSYRIGVWNSNGTLTLEGSADGSTGWTTIHAFPLSSLGTTHWHGGPYSATIPAGQVAAYRHIRVAFVKTGYGFETALYSLITTGQAMV